MLPLIGWVLIWMRPTWNFLFYYSIAIGVFALLISFFLGGGIALLPTTPPLEFVAFYGIQFVLNVGVFAVVGAIIVAVRGGKSEQRSPSSAEIDSELARVRAEIAKRDGAGQKAPDSAGT